MVADIEVFEEILVLTDAENPCPICNGEMHGVNRSLLVCEEHQDNYVVTLCPDCGRSRFSTPSAAGVCLSCKRKRTERRKLKEAGFVIADVGGWRQNADRL